MNVKSVRRENMRALAKSVGGMSKLALKLHKSQSQLSHLIGYLPIKNIGDKIAAQVEAAFDKPSGWLDKEHARIEETQAIDRIDPGQSVILCRQVPLITWCEAKEWNQLAYHYQPKPHQMMTTTAPVSTFAFALTVQDDSMQAPSGMSFPEGALIIADPDQIAAHGSFVVVTVNHDKEATLQQLVSDGHKRYFKSLNPRYPIAEFTMNSTLYGVVKQMVVDFKS